MTKELISSDIVPNKLIKLIYFCINFLKLFNVIKTNVD